MSIPDWRKPTPPDPGADPVARVREKESQHREPHDVESESAQVIARIWQGFSEDNSLTHRNPVSGTREIRSRYADQTRGLRLLVEEIQQDTEVAAVLRTGLADRLRAMVEAQVRQPSGAGYVDEARQQDCAVRPYHRTSHGHSAMLRLLQEETDLSSKLRDAEDILRGQRVAHLKAAVALLLTRTGGPGSSRAIAADCVEVAESLGEIADALGSMRQRSDANRSLEAAGDLSERLRHATEQSARSSTKLCESLLRFLEDRVSSHVRESASVSLTVLGGMLDLGPRLRYSTFDPGPEEAFRSVGDELACSFFEVLRSGDEGESPAFDAELASSP